MLKQLIVFLLLLSGSYGTMAQRGTTQPKRDSLPYQKYPTLPAFNLLMTDSSTIFNTYNIPEGKPTVLMFFSPDCDHCQQTTRALTDRMDSLKQVQFYLFTPMSLSMIRDFAAKQHLGQYKNITIGQDYEYFFPGFYGASYVPYVAVYDRKKRFVKMWEGRVKIEDVMAVLSGL